MLGSGTGLTGKSKSRTTTGKAAQMSIAIRGEAAIRCTERFKGAKTLAHCPGRVSIASAVSARRSHSNANPIGDTKRMASEIT